MKKKILITGGAGFIGFNILKSLHNKYDVTLIDNFSRGKFDSEIFNFVKNNKIKVIKQDLQKKIDLKNSYEYIFHLAATVGVKNVIQNPIYTFKNNIDSLLKVIDFCKKKKRYKINFFFNQ